MHVPPPSRRSARCGTLPATLCTGFRAQWTGFRPCLLRADNYNEEVVDDFAFEEQNDNYMMYRNNSGEVLLH